MTKAFFIPLLLLASISTAQEPERTVGKDVELRRQTDRAVLAGLKYLVATQREDGGWEMRGISDPAVTALAAKCFIQHPDYGPGHPIVRRAIDHVLTFRQPDGGFYIKDVGLDNYYTSVILMALSALHDSQRAADIRGAQRFLKKLQWDENEGYEANSPWYGGAGYGQHKRPDLSNTQMMLEALHQSGLPPDDPVYKKAMRFIERSQLLDETNDQAFADGRSDGGFIYTPVNDGESKAGLETVDGKVMLRSYGSMTYAGFKSMLYANVPRDDVRVRRALEWIRRYYTLDHNPNMPGKQSQEGLYYYYHVFAKALAAWGEPVVVGADGEHRWREDLCRALIARQKPDGSWVNRADRWYESNPALVTSYAVLALQTALSE